MVDVASETAPSGTNPYLAGNFAPVSTETTIEGLLPVDGAIPPDLEGLWVRNGPNPVGSPDPDRYHWFSGDGMVHAIELREGRAVSYRSRWVRTRRLASAVGGRPPRGPREPIDGPANTHVIWHAGKLLALVESGFPHRLTTDLATVCVEDFDGTLTSPMTAHPRVDPDTGGLVFFGYDVFGPPYLRYHEMDRDGTILHTTEVGIPQATMQHDFAVTASRVAFLDLPVVFDAGLSERGVSLPFRWDPESGARVGVMARGGPGTAVRWVDTDPCFVFHVVNAFDEGDDVVLDVLRYEQTFDTPPGGVLGTTLPTLERWRVGEGATAVARTPLDDRTVELPRVDDLVAGRPYRYAYCAEVARVDGADRFGGLLCYDLGRDEVVRHDPGPGRAAGEPIFVRGPGGRADNEGWVLSVVHDAARGASDLVVIDATSFSGRPEAVVHLPVRVPFGFHGSWVPASRYR